MERAKRAILVFPFVVAGFAFIPDGMAPAGFEGDDRFVAVTTAVGPGTDFLATTRSGAPARWDPCRPIAYWINPRGVPDPGLVHAAVDRLAEATGLGFVFSGTTGRRPTRVASEPDALRGILIGWERPGGNVLLDGDELATTSVGWRRRAGGLEIVAAAIAVNSETTARLGSGFGGRSLGGVLLHELGHAVGLAHVGDRTQIMAQGLPHPPEWGSGDLRGLLAVGAAGCPG